MKARLIRVEEPDRWAMGENRRRFFRVPASMRITFAWAEGFELYRTVDLSACGALVRVPPRAEVVLPPEGTRGEAAFNLESYELRVEARVTRVTKTTFALEFERVRPAQQDRICGWAFRQAARKGPTF
jgi:c-di-GMP-binding flagellar brake protein YcgR